jgi:hypothetical protein
VTSDVLLVDANYFRDTLRGVDSFVSDLELDFLTGLHDVSL